MVTCSPVYGLETIEGTDRPCDFADTQCAEVTTLREQIALLAGINNRTAITIPIVKIAMTIPAEAGTDAQLTSTSTNLLIRPIFDTVMVDTDNMFTSDQPQQVIVNTPGMYGLFFQMQIASTAGSGNIGGMTGRVDIAPTTTIARDNVSFAPGGTYNMAFSGAWPVPVAGTVLVPGIQFLINSPDTVLPLYIEFGAYWLGDLP